MLVWHTKSQKWNTSVQYRRWILESSHSCLLLRPCWWCDNLKGLVQSRWSDCEATSAQESRGGWCHVYAPPRGDNKTLGYPDISVLLDPLYIILLLDHDSDIYSLHLSRPPAPPPPARSNDKHSSFSASGRGSKLGRKCFDKKVLRKQYWSKIF